MKDWFAQAYPGNARYDETGKTIPAADVARPASAPEVLRGRDAKEIGIS